MEGIFISLEGVEGAGKSTQARLLAEALEKKGLQTVLTAEPGGTALGRRIRGLLLDVEQGGMDPLTELLLYAAARREHLKKLILPALHEGRVVITDRFSDSTLAYQGYARGLDPALIETLDAMVTGGLKPHITLLLEVDVKTGLERNRLAGKADRLELEAEAFHDRVREGFLRIKRAAPDRVIAVEGNGGPDAVHRSILNIVQRLIEEKTPPGR